MVLFLESPEQSRKEVREEGERLAGNRVSDVAFLGNVYPEQERRYAFRTTGTFPSEHPIPDGPNGGGGIPLKKAA